MVPCSWLISRHQCKGKNIKIWRTFCFFLQFTEGSYICTNIIDKNMRNIYKLIHMSFLYIGYDIFPSIALHTTFCRFCFRFVQTTVILLASLLRFIINWPQTFINAYKLYFVLVHNVYIALENVELVPVLSSVFYYLLCFLENRA